MPAIIPVADALTLRAKGTACASLGFAEYVPTNYSGKSFWPLIVALNGKCQSGADGARDIQKIDGDVLPKEIKNNSWGPAKRFCCITTSNEQGRTNGGVA